MKTKLFFLLIVMIGLSFTLHAQTEKGSIMLGGGSGIGLSSNSLRLSLSPQVGYFVQDNLAVGIKSYLSLTRQREFFDILPRGGWDFTASADINAFARYYFPSEKKWRPFLHTELGYAGQDTFQGRFEGGVAFFVSDNFSLDISAGIGSVTNGQTFNTRFQGPRIGFNFFLGGKKKEK